MLIEARKLVDRLCQRQAQSFYFMGILGTVLVMLFIAVLALVVAGGMPALSSLPDWGRLLGAATLGGAIGAMVSVMQRMASGEFSLQYRAPRIALVTLGAVRPVIGAVFGGLVAVLVEARLLPILPAAADPTSPFLLTALGFIAGFSERWAQDMLADASPMPALGLNKAENTKGPAI